MEEINIIPEETADKDEFSLYDYLKKKYKNILIILLSLLLIIFYVVSNYKLNKAEKNYKENYASLKEKAYLFNSERDLYYLNLVAQTFSFAILSEMIRNNYENISIYATSVIRRDKNMQEILVANSMGDVVISTNKKYENTSIRDYLLINYITIKDIKIVPDQNSETLTIVSPIKAINENIGYLVIKYKPLKFEIDALDEFL